MKALLLAGLCISTASLAQTIFCQGNGENYLIKTVPQIEVFLHPIPRRPDIQSAMTVIDEGVVSKGCAWNPDFLCLEIPFYNPYSNKFGDNLLNISEKEKKQLSATLTSVNGNVSFPKCTFVDK